MRPQITTKEIDSTLKRVVDWLDKRIKEKGYGSFSSIHEIRGVIDEEIIELKDAMHEKDYAAMEHELKDVIVAGIFGLACLKSGKMDW